jgi:sugar transferase (PEP-CTERM system associated)
MKQSVRKIVVALEENRGKLPLRELLRCKMEGLSVVDGVSFYESLTGNILVEDLKPSWLIFSEGFKKPPVRMFSKRIFGIIISFCGIIATLPISLLAVLCIKLESRGPVFYAQVRCGEKGKPFNLYKFRSMTANAEKETGAVWAQENDPRITKVGRIIRKLRIDEIPQMWNVLRGDMSFVGPRPERPEFVDELKEQLPFYEERMNVKPGITGWAQVRREYGSSIEDALDKLRYDLYYIKNMNFFFDLKIMFETVKIILLGRGAR